MFPFPSTLASGVIEAMNKLLFNASLVPAEQMAQGIWLSDSHHLTATIHYQF